MTTAGISATALVPDAFRSRRSEGASGAWDRELERALTPSWFHGPLAEQSPRRLAEPPQPRERTTGQFGAQGPRGGERKASLADSFPVHHGESSADLRIPSLARSASSASPYLQPGPSFWSAQLFDQKIGLPDAVPPGREPGHRCGAAERPAYAAHASATPVRLHVEHGDGGWIVWIGVDGNASEIEARSKQLLDELQRHARDLGQRVAGVICNGRWLHRDEALHFEPAFLSWTEAP